MLVTTVNFKPTVLDYVWCMFTYLILFIKPQKAFVPACCSPVSSCLINILNMFALAQEISLVGWQKLVKSLPPLPALRNLAELFFFGVYANHFQHLALPGSAECRRWWLTDLHCQCEHHSWQPTTQIAILLRLSFAANRTIPVIKHQRVCLVPTCVR